MSSLRLGPQSADDAICLSSLPRFSSQLFFAKRCVVDWVKIEL